MWRNHGGRDGARPSPKGGISVESRQEMIFGAENGIICIVFMGVIS